MHKIDTPTAENGKFVDGNPNQGIKGTQVDSSWLNSVQDEILAPIIAAGITPSKDDNSQLLSAIKKLFLAKTIVKNYEGAVTTRSSEESGFGLASFANGSKIDFTITINNKSQVNDTFCVTLFRTKSAFFNLNILGYQSLRIVANMDSSYNDFLGVYNFPFDNYSDGTYNLDLYVEGIIFGA